MMRRREFITLLAARLRGAAPAPLLFVTPRILQVSLDTDDTKSRLPRLTLDDQNGGFGDLPDVY